MKTPFQEIMRGYHLRIMDLNKRGTPEPGFITLVPLTAEQYEQIRAAQGSGPFGHEHFVCEVVAPQVEEGE